MVPPHLVANLGRAFLTLSACGTRRSFSRHGAYEKKFACVRRSPDHERPRLHHATRPDPLPGQRRPDASGRPSRGPGLRTAWRSAAIRPRRKQTRQDVQRHRERAAVGEEQEGIFGVPEEGHRPGFTARTCEVAGRCRQHRRRHRDRLRRARCRGRAGEDAGLVRRWPVAARATGQGAVRCARAAVQRVGAGHLATAAESAKASAGVGALGR